MNSSRPCITTRVALAISLLPALLAGCGGGLDPILGTPGVTVAPVVSATSPVASAIPVSGVATNSAVTATFSKSMMAATVNGSSFTLTCPGTSPVAATVSYVDATRIATLTPSAVLPNASLCQASVSTAVKDSTGIAMENAFVWRFMTAPLADTARPTVVLSVPTPASTGVPINSLVTASFSEDMNATTLSGSSFSVTNTTLGTAVAGSVSYSAAARTATFTPTAGSLASNSAFSATITAAATDLAGNGLAGNTAVLPAAGQHVWTFSTGAVGDTTRPTVVLSVPTPASTGVPINSLVTASFSEDMNATPLSGSSFSLTNTTLGTAVAGSVSYSAAARTATFTPTAGSLASSSAFSATISAAATDLAGNGLAGNTAVLPAAGQHVWTFSTGAAGDATAPTVTAISPAAGSTSCLSKAVSATFSEPMDASTISATTLRVSRAGVAVAGSVRYDAASQVASFVPSSAAGFAASSTFDAVVVGGNTGVKDLAGNALAVDRSWSFQTGTQPCATGVALGSIASFGSFGGAAGITNQGINTVVGGNIGTTAACTLITGLHDASNVYTETPLNIGVVNGSVFCAPPAPGTATSMAIATQARADALSAYNALAALPPGSDPGAGPLGGLVLQAGVYTAAGGSFGITTGDLTLDAQGDTNAVWVFQSASALTVGLPATPRRVLLVNGAQAGNVYWQVGSAARIEDRSLMVGTIIAPAGVTISTAGQAGQTTLIGRAIGLTASVTMVNTTVVAP